MEKENSGLQSADSIDFAAARKMFQISKDPSSSSNKVALKLVDTNSVSTQDKDHVQQVTTQSTVPQDRHLETSNQRDSTPSPNVDRVISPVTPSNGLPSKDSLPPSYRMPLPGEVPPSPSESGPKMIIRKRGDTSDLKWLTAVQNSVDRSVKYWLLLWPRLSSINQWSNRRH